MAATWLKVVAFLVFFAFVGGATYAVQLDLGGSSSLASSAFRMDAPRALLNATPGHTVTYDVVVANRGSTANDVTVTLSGAGFPAGAPATARVAAGTSVTVFASIDVPTTLAPGSYPLAAHLATSDGSVTRDQSDLLTLRVLPVLPASGFDNASTVRVLYTGRLATNGQVFNSNDPNVLGLPNFPKTGQYVPSTGELEVSGADPTQLVEGFFDALRGIQPGESRTVTIPYDKAYGPATVTTTVNRTETFPRTFDLPVRVETVARGTFDSYVNDTNQTGPFHVGSTFFFVQAPNKWPYKIASIDATSVGYVIDVKQGESYTLFPFWTNASVVRSVNATTVEFYTTPTTSVGEAFTVRPYWPDYSAILSENDTTVVVQHSPPVNFKFTEPATQFQQATDEVVSAINDTTITLQSPSTNPLAGQDLVFDVLAVEVAR
jgi:FKBP-type peptidyl-prolyl cis-trans isomerase 2